MQAIPVPVPTYERQLWFDHLYEKVETAKRTMTQAVEERNAILPSVLNQVFGGGEVESPTVRQHRLEFQLRD